LTAPAAPTIVPGVSRSASVALFLVITALSGAASIQGVAPGVTVEKNQPAKMRDGVILRADVYRPRAPGTYPVLLQRTPYSKNDEESPKRFSNLAAKGFIVVVQDTRGRYTSDGVAVPHDEAADGFDSVQWAAALPGSNGRVGMFGGSYLATTQLEAATLQPPALRALFPASSYARRHDMVFQGGAFYLSDGLSWNLGQALDVRRRVLTPNEDRDGPIGLDAEQRQMLRNKWYWHLPLKSFDELDLRRFAPGYFQMLDHPSFDSFWDPADIEKRHDRFLVPAFHITGWYDTLLTGTLKNFTGLRARAANERARQYQRLVVGPWTHARPTRASTSIGDVSFGPNAGFDSEGALVRWFDHWLKDGDRAVLDTTPVRLFVMGANEWRDEQEWPLARAKPTAYYLSSGGRANTADGDGQLGTTAPPASSSPDVYTYDPANPVPTGASGGYSRHPADQRGIEQRQDILVYTSAPLPADIEVTGPLALTIWIQSSARDTDFTGKLVDVFPDGTARALADGILRARYRKGPATPELLTPGTPTEVTIDLGATANLFKAGHRIRLEVSSSNFPRFDRNPNTGGTFGEDGDVSKAEQRLLHDAAHPSRLLLPVVPRPAGGRTAPAAAGVAGAVGTSGIAPTQPANADTSFVITNARLIDGTGAPARPAAVRVANGRIAEVGALTPGQAERVIDAGGLVLAPGFIDAHNHSTDGLLTEPLAASQVSQGITTVFVGQDGSSPWPIADYLSQLRTAPPALNVITAVGHATVRQQVMGEDYKRAARPDEITKMEALVDQGMREGAVALSSGLEYEVGSYSTTDEIVALAKVAAKYKGIYISHTRDEADKSFDSIREIISIAERAKIPAQNTHLKLGTIGVWHKAAEAIRLLDQARARGLDVTADVYPYNAWSSTITVLIPSKRYDDPEAVTQGLSDVGGAGNILITRHAAHPDYEFKTLADVARAQNITPVQAFIRIVKDGGASVVCTSMVDDDIRAFVGWPHAMFSSDGGIGMRHPRGAGSFPRVLGLFVRERKWLSLEEAIRKMTSLPATRLSLPDRGTVTPGMWADLVLLDPDTVIDRSTFSEPFLLSAGIRRVWVNGAAVWQDDRTVGARPGKVLGR
jgi:putative CocE/NonD family hydrolase